MHRQQAKLKKDRHKARRMGQAKSRYRRVVQEQLQRNGDMRMLTRDDKEAALQILMQAFANNDGFLWTVREDDLSEEEAKARYLT